MQGSRSRALRASARFSPQTLFQIMLRFFLLFILCFTTAKAVIVDIQPYAFACPAPRAKGPSFGQRVLVFDPLSQRLIRLIYVDENSLPLRLNEGVVVHKGQQPRTGKLPAPQAAVSFSCEKIKAVLESKRGKRSQEDLQVKWVSSPSMARPCKLGQIAPTQNLNSKELGEIGERLTELSFLSFGCEKLDSKYEHNHGLDGAYVCDKESLFVTESKFRPGESKSAAKYMKESLSEGKLRELYERMKKKGLCPRLTALIKAKLEGRGDFYRVVQRVRKTGAVDSLVRPISIRAWHASAVAPTQGLSYEEKLRMLEEFMDSLFSSEEKRKARQRLARM